MSESKENKKRIPVSARTNLIILLVAFIVVRGLYGPVVTSYLVYTIAFLVTFGALIFGSFLIIRSYSSGDRELQSVEAEIEALAKDASFDVNEQIIVWDKLILTKGLGTPLEGREEEVSQIHRRLINARQEIAVAESPQHRLEAVLSADAILATARSLH